MQDERERIASLGYSLVDDATASTSRPDLASALDEADGIYVAGGNTFVLLQALRNSGADTLIAERVRAGMPYIGASAGSVVVGPSIEPASLLDERSDAPGLDDLTGLGLIESVIIPHADGALPPYPPELIERTVSRYGEHYPLLLVRDDQAVLVDASGTSLIASL